MVLRVVFSSWVARLKNTTIPLEEFNSVSVSISEFSLVFQFCDARTTILFEDLNSVVSIGDLTRIQIHVLCSFKTTATTSTLSTLL